MGITATDPFVSRDSMARHTIDAFGQDPNATIEQTRHGDIVVRTSTTGKRLSRAERYHGDLRFKPKRRKRRRS